MIRKEAGVSMVELLVATAIMGFVAAGTLGLVYLNWKTNQRVENKTDAVNAARQAIERISYEVRQARSVGDGYGYVIPPSGQVVDLASGAVTVTTDTSVVDPAMLVPPSPPASQFPAAGNPYTTLSQAMISGNGWPNPPYQLGSRCLIVQKPVFTAQGFPAGQSYNGFTIESLDTYVYQVLPDPVRTGEWRMQVAGFPATGSTMQSPRVAKTILTGITGPLDASGQPRVFQYLLSASSAPRDGATLSAGEIDDVSGVTCTLEVRQSQASATSIRKGMQQAVVPFKQEIYLRNNTLTTTVAY